VIMARTTPQTRAAQALTQALAAVLGLPPDSVGPRLSEAIVSAAAYIGAAATPTASNKLALLESIVAVAVNTDSGSSALAFFVVNARGLFMGATVHAEDAAALVALLGDGATVRCNVDSILWSEGSEAFPAGESYDAAAEVMLKRLGNPRATLLRRA
jgi:hypothetical protein